MPAIGHLLDNQLKCRKVRIKYFKFKVLGIDETVMNFSFDLQVRRKQFVLKLGTTRQVKAQESCKQPDKAPKTAEHMVDRIQSLQSEFFCKIRMKCH